jgi:hypothetical protein
METMRRYQKALVARHSPENRCYVPDGERLIIDPVLPVNPRPGRQHRFVGIKHPELTSRFGWVVEVAPFEIDDLLAEHTGDWLGGTELLRLLLESIAGLPEGTPVAATFAERILPKKETYLSVHRVVLR